MATYLLTKTTMEQLKSNPECEKIEGAMAKIVESARSLFRNIKDGEEIINDCEDLGINSNVGSIQAHKDWLALAKTRFQMMREEFQHLLESAPGAASKLKLSELNELFGDNGITLEETEEEMGSLQESHEERIKDLPA